MHHSSHRSQLLAARAHAMRSSMTDTEAALWRALSGRKLCGVAFRRQLVLGERYIVDFAAPAVRLVVEVDGGWHAGREGADARRDHALARLGWRVVRLDAELVRHDLPQALVRIRAALEAA